jgi:hypothetical protein
MFYFYFSWDSLWLVEEGLTLLCFLIVRIEISCFLWEIFQSRFIMIPFISSRTGKVFIFHLVPNSSGMPQTLHPCRIAHQVHTVHLCRIWDTVLALKLETISG